MASKEEEITDSTDWLPTPVPMLAPVEAALRCHVCKDFFTSAMITTCSHTFCSLCIRRCLSVTGQCPECRAPDQEMKLKPNSTVQELVDMFVAARPSLMQLAKQTERVASTPGSPKRKRKIEESSMGQGPQKKRTSGRSTRSTPVIVDSEGDDDDYTPEAGHVDDNLVACPICQERFPTEAAVGRHLDNCGNEPVKPQHPTGAIAQLVSKPLNISRTRIAAANFDLMKEPQIRKKLMEYSLSTSGTKELMVRRWREWTLLFNSNLDNEKTQKSDNALRKELDIWEKTQGSRAPGMNSHQRGTQIKDKDFDTQAYSAKHETSFKDLIANARKRAVKKENKSEADNSATATDAPIQRESVHSCDTSSPADSPNSGQNIASGAILENSDAFPSPGLPKPHSLETRSVRIPEIYFQDDLRSLTGYGQSSYNNPPLVIKESVQYPSAAPPYTSHHFNPPRIAAPGYGHELPTVPLGRLKTYESLLQAQTKFQDEYASPSSSQLYDSSPRQGGGSGP